MLNAIAASAVDTGSSARSVRRQVLVVRSCRAEQFAVAVQLARSRTPGARVFGLTVAGHRHAVLAGGVDEIIEVPGQRFSLLRMPPRTLHRLRSHRFDEIVVPQMIPDPGRHLNVYCLAAALIARRVVIVPGDAQPRILDRRGLLVLIRRAIPEWLVYRLDTPIFATLVVAAFVMSRAAAPARATGRRRVLHVIGSLGTGGAQVQLAELLNRTPREEFDVDLMLLNSAAGSSSTRLITREDIDITSLTQWPNRTRLILEIIAHCRTRQYDLVHTWLPGTNIIAGTAARLARVPRVIASVRGMSKSRKWWYPEWWWRPLDALTSRAADAVTVNAAALVTDCARFAWMPASRIQVVHNGLDPSSLLIDRKQSRARVLEETSAPRDAILVGVVGRLVHEKDHATFLQMLAQVRTSRPDVHGVIVGDGRLRRSLEQLTDTLGLANAVTFLGDRRDARALMAGFDLFVLPSVAEGFPNVLLEATFLGVPCVATDVGGVREVLGPESPLFRPGDLNACANQVLGMLADPVRTAAHTERVRARALELFTSDRSVNTWLALYRRCLNTPTSACARWTAQVDTPPLGTVGQY